MYLKSIKSFNQILEVFLGVFAFIIFLILIPPLVLFLITIQLYRWSLILFVKLFKREIVRMMTGNSPLLAVDDIHTRPRCNIVCCGVFEGTTPEHMVQIARSSFLTRDPLNEQLAYPESQQYYEEWMGCMWWKKEKDFKIEEHVFAWQNENQISEKEYMKIISSLEAKPFSRGKSPWEVIIVPNVLVENVKNPETPKVAMIYRFHHGLADGISVLQLMLNCMFTDSIDKIPKPAYKKRTTVEKRLFQFSAFFQIPYQFVKQLVCAMDKNEWHLPDKKLSRKIYKSCTRRIPLGPIRKVRTKHGVGFTAVLISVLAGALRKVMIKQKVNVPERMHAISPLPWPKHPQEFCNHWTFGYLELPTGEPSSLKRLRSAHTHFEGLKQSVLPIVNFYAVAFINILPTWVLKNALITNKLPKVFISNFPGPPPESVGKGFNIVDSMFAGGPHRGNIGIHFRIMSCDNAIRVVVGVDSSILKTQEMLEEFIEVIEKEFLELGECMLGS